MALSLDWAQKIALSRRPKGTEPIDLELPWTQHMLNFIYDSWPFLVGVDFLEDRNLYFDAVTSSFRPIHVEQEPVWDVNDSPYKWDNRYITVIKKSGGQWRKCLSVPDKRGKERYPRMVCFYREAGIPDASMFMNTFYHKEKEEKEVAERFWTTTALSFYLAASVAEDPDIMKKRNPAVKRIPQQRYALPYAVPLIPVRLMTYVPHVIICLPTIFIRAPTPISELPDASNNQGIPAICPDSRPSLDNSSVEKQNTATISRL